MSRLSAPDVMLTDYTVTFLNGPDQYVFFRPEGFKEEDVDVAMGRAIDLATGGLDGSECDPVKKPGLSDVCLAIVRLVLSVPGIYLAVKIYQKPDMFVGVGKYAYVFSFILVLLSLTLLSMFMDTIAQCAACRERREKVNACRSVRGASILQLVVEDLGLEWLPLTDALTAERVRLLDMKEDASEEEKKERERLYKQWLLKSRVHL